MTTRYGVLVHCILAFASLVNPAAAEDPPSLSWHAGIEFRPGYAVRPLRLGAGVTSGSLEVHAVLDPLAFTDRIHDLDLTVSYELLASGYSVMAGWRPTAIWLPSSTQWQHSALIGGLAQLPELSRWIRALFGLELGMLIARHGGALPAEANCFCDDQVTETLGFGALLRIEYASAH